MHSLPCLYRGYDAMKAKKVTEVMLIGALVNVTKWCLAGDTRNGWWVLVGLVGKWPETGMPYLHTPRARGGDALPKGWCPCGGRIEPSLLQVSWLLGSFTWRSVCELLVARVRVLPAAGTRRPYSS